MPLQSRTKANEIVDDTLQVVSQWPDYAKDAGVPAVLSTLIHDNLRLSL